MVAASAQDANSRPPISMGAEGVILGTRMLVAEELWIHRKHKELIVDADGTESAVIKTAIRDHHRVYLNDSARAVMELDRLGVTDFETTTVRTSTAH